MKNFLAFLLFTAALLGAQAFSAWPGAPPLLGENPGNSAQFLNVAAGNSRGTVETIQIQFQPVFKGEKVALEAPLQNIHGDSMALHTLRFYLSNFVFLKNGAIVYAEKDSHHLLDLEVEHSLDLGFQLPENSRFDELKFDLGIDSLTQVSGAMGKDLDPTKGMFWTWQSGYINVKLEGFHERSPARNHEFQFHLGGYASPFQSQQCVRLAIPKEGDLKLVLDLAPFFEQVEQSYPYSIMSPAAAAVDLTKTLANSFRVYAK